MEIPKGETKKSKQRLFGGVSKGARCHSRRKRTDGDSLRDRKKALVVLGGGACIGKTSIGKELLKSRAYAL